MSLKDVRVGFAITGSHCTLDGIFVEIKRLVAAGAKVYPIISEAVKYSDTRFGTAKFWREELVRITGNPVISTIIDAEPIGPQGLLDVIVVAPCTGNTLAKLANGITDGPVLMGVKAHLRNNRPVVLAISTNDGLGINAKNIGLLINMKNIYMVPFGQDNPTSKANSLISKIELIDKTVELALEGKQIQPVLVAY